MQGGDQPLLFTHPLIIPSCLQFPNLVFHIFFLVQLLPMTSLWALYLLSFHAAGIADCQLVDLFCANNTFRSSFVWMFMLKLFLFISNATAILVPPHMGTPMLCQQFIHFVLKVFYWMAAVCNSVKDSPIFCLLSA